MRLVACGVAGPEKYCRRSVKWVGAGDGKKEDLGRKSGGGECMVSRVRGKSEDWGRKAHGPGTGKCPGERMASQVPGESADRGRKCR